MEICSCQAEHLSHAKVTLSLQVVIAICLPLSFPPSLLVSCEAVAVNWSSGSEEREWGNLYVLSQITFFICLFPGWCPASPFIPEVKNFRLAASLKPMCGSAELLSLFCSADKEKPEVWFLSDMFFHFLWKFVRVPSFHRCSFFLIDFFPLKNRRNIFTQFYRRVTRKLLSVWVSCDVTKYWDNGNHAWLCSMFWKPKMLCGLSTYANLRLTC